MVLSKKMAEKMPKAVTITLASAIMNTGTRTKGHRSKTTFAFSLGK